MSPNLKPHPNLWQHNATPLPSLRSYYVKTISGGYDDLRTKGDIPRRIYSPLVVNIFSEHGLVYHPAALYSAALAERYPAKGQKSERAIWTLDRAKSFLFGDNAGYSIGKGNFLIDWNKPVDVEHKRLGLLRWLERVPNVVPYLDIPPWTIDKSNIFTSFEDCVEETRNSIEHWRREARWEIPWLVVAHGRTLQETVDWWHAFKVYPAIGIAFGSVLGENLFILVHLLRIIEKEGYLNRFWLLHFFGHFTTKFFVTVSVLQRVIQLRYPHIRITFDATTPFAFAETNDVVWLTRDKGLAGRDYSVHKPPTPTFLSDRSVPFPSSSRVFEELDGADFIKDNLSYVLYGLHNLDQMLQAFKAWGRDIEIAVRAGKKLQGIEGNIDQIVFLFSALREALWSKGDAGLWKHEQYLNTVF